MKINSVKFQNEGCVHCRSNVYTAYDSISMGSLYAFYTGINKLVGGIDSGNWAISYMFSMYTHRPEDFTLFNTIEVFANDEGISIDKLSELSCYMDTLHPLFSGNDSVKDLVIQGVRQSGLNYSCNDIQEMFCLDSERFERPLSRVGNEIFRAMAAIGVAHKKEVFCFPWLSKNRFVYYHENLTVLLEILESLKKMVILPVEI